MGPAVSRPDDLPALAVVVNVPRLQWGRPFHGRMTSLMTPAGPSSTCFNGPAVSRPDDVPLTSLAGTELASMGPAVSRPDDRSSSPVTTSSSNSFNGAGRFTAG